MRKQANQPLRTYIFFPFPRINIGEVKEIEDLSKEASFQPGKLKKFEEVFNVKFGLKTYEGEDNNSIIFDSSFHEENVSVEKDNSRQTIVNLKLAR